MIRKKKDGITPVRLHSAAYDPTAFALGQKAKSLAGLCVVQPGFFSGRVPRRMG